MRTSRESTPAAAGGRRRADGSPSHVPIAFLTDVEGQWERLRSFADGHPGLRLDGERLEVAAGWTFLFGGDAIDRGPHGRRVVRALLDAKRRQPDAVRWLIGNRDLNKLRLRRELDGHPPPRAQGSTRPALLRWIFENTMGAPDAFAFRQAELAAEGLPSDDDTVVDSFLADIAPDGDLFAILDQGALAIRAGSALFVHGGVTPENLGHTPGSAPTADVDRWIAALEDFRADGVDAYRRGVLRDGVPGGYALVAYQAPLSGTRANAGSVIYGRTVDAANHLRRPAAAARAWLADNGVDRVIVGHTPIGDVPAIVADDRLVLVCADNSRATHPRGSWVAIDDRGVDVDAWATVAGTLARVTARVVPGDTGPVGLERADGTQVRGRLGDGRWLVHRMAPGYRSETQAVEALGPLRLAEEDGHLSAAGRG